VADVCGHSFQRWVPPGDAVGVEANARDSSQLENRLQGENRRVFKFLFLASKAEPRDYLQALVLLEDLIRLGSERVVNDARDHQYHIRSLQDFNYYDPEEQKDRGAGG